MKRKYILIPVAAILLLFINNQCKKESTAQTTRHQAEDTLLFNTSERAIILNGDTDVSMRVLTIFNIQDSIQLRERSHNVKADPGDSVLLRLIRRMYHTVIDSQGVGIAAPQVGINRNIIWVQRLDKTGKPFECYLNPKIIIYSNKSVVFTGDGCLSIPGIYGNSHRFSSVAVEYDRPDGSHNSEIIEGYSGNNFTSIIFQHEIDHLLGILFIDRINK